MQPQKNGQTTKKVAVGVIVALSAGFFLLMAAFPIVFGSLTFIDKMDRGLGLDKMRVRYRGAELMKACEALKVPAEYTVQEPCHVAMNDGSGPKYTYGAAVIRFAASGPPSEMGQGMKTIAENNGYQEVKLVDYMPQTAPYVTATVSPKTKANFRLQTASKVTEGPEVPDSFYVEFSYDPDSYLVK